MITKSNNNDVSQSIIRIVCFVLMLFGICKTSEATTYNISVQDYSFAPNNINVIVGDTVVWIWKGPNSYSTTCDGYDFGTLPQAAEPWDTPLTQDRQSYTYIIHVPGIYNYVSKPQFFVNNMTGSINAEVTLPVELTDFVATTIKNEVILDWFTGGEINNERFEIQRVDLDYLGDLNPNDMPFYTVGMLRGMGNSSNMNHYKFIDRNLKTGRYLYRLKQVDYNSNFIFHLLPDEVVVGVPDKLNISQNYPNPFNPVTKIDFELPVDGFVSLKLFDINGKEVMDLVNEYRTSGYQTLIVNGSSLPSGVYYYRLRFDNGSKVESFTMKMMLIK